MCDLLATSDTEHRWLAKVPAGDPVACMALDLARTLPDAEWDDFARSVERIRAGMPAADVLAVMQPSAGRVAP